jgi:diphthamide synthase (EF-2-diphthine--ammonia ligase)
LVHAERAAEQLELRWRRVMLTLAESEVLLHQAAGCAVVDWNVVKAGVSMTMLAACRLAAADGTDLVLSGLGSEEVFAGYHRHANALAGGEGEVGMRLECVAGLAQMYHRDLQRDFAIAEKAGVAVAYPYLDQELIDYALFSSLPEKSMVDTIDPPLEESATDVIEPPPSSIAGSVVVDANTEGTVLEQLGFNLLDAGGKQQGVAGPIAVDAPDAVANGGSGPGSTRAERRRRKRRARAARRAAAPGNGAELGGPEEAGGLSRASTDAAAGKLLLRRVAEAVGVPPEVWRRKKRAAQYGSRFHYALRTLGKRWALEGTALPGLFGEQSRTGLSNLVMAMVPADGAGPAPAPGMQALPHSRLALLFTSGKDSAQAHNAFRKAHCEFGCVVGPAEPVARAAAAAFAATAGLPLLAVPARLHGSSGWGGGAKYDETSLRAALVAAVATYGVGGVVCGHVADLGRWLAVIAACDAVQLRSYAPLWRCWPPTKVCELMVADGCQLAVNRTPAAGGVALGTTMCSKADVLAVAVALSSCNPSSLDGDSGLFDAVVLGLDQFLCAPPASCA